jgi:hypothetical protein
LVEIHTAYSKGIQLIVLPLEDRIDWKSAWPMDKCMPVLQGYFPEYKGAGGANRFALNRGEVLEHLQSLNTYPPPGAVATMWGEDGAREILQWVVHKAAKIAGVSTSEVEGGTMTTKPTI